MGRLVGDNQTSFIPERHASDNSIIVQEMIRTMRRKTGKSGVMALKVDLEKAYDRIHWGFLERILPAVGFDLNLTKLIMLCVTSTKLSLLWNGEMLEPCVPQIVLRQGDPLSLYLFVLCTEVLGQLIGAGMDKRCWKIVKSSRSGQASPASFLETIWYFLENLRQNRLRLCRILWSSVTLVAKR